jgi:hypothetical protein
MLAALRGDMNRTRAAAVAAMIAMALTAKPAHATPRPLPFTYTTDTLAPGELEVEQYVDVTSAKAVGLSNSPVYYAVTQFQTEFEYGIANRLELGLYVVYVPTPANYLELPETTETTGVKERLRYVLADPGAWPIDVGLYGELVEGQTEAELEGKILLQRRFGNLRVDANLWAEYEAYYAAPPTHRDVVINPTLGATYEVTPAVHVGVESWLRAEFPNVSVPSPRPTLALGPVVYAGPAVLFNFGKLWWSTGLYARVTDVGLISQLGDIYGPIWARTVIGLSL